MRAGEGLFWLMRRRTTRARPPYLSDVRRLLLVRLDKLGDVVLTTPFLREIRRNLPDALITLVVRPMCFELVERCPYVNRVLVFDCHAGRDRGAQTRRRVQMMRMARSELWPRHFDLAIVPRWDTDLYDASFLAYWSGASWRAGFSESTTLPKKHQNAGFDRLFTQVFSGEARQHEVEHNLDVIRFLGGTVESDRLEVWTSPEDDAFAAAALKAVGGTSGPHVIAFGVGAGEPKNVWPLAHFGQLGSRLKATVGARIVVVGGPGEEPLGRELQRQLGTHVLNLTGAATLRQTAAVLRSCNLFVGNDSGQMHLAAAAGIPVVGVSCHPLDGSPIHEKSPARFGTWRVPSVGVQPETARNPCSEACTADAAHCILNVSVQEVEKAVKTLLQRTAGGPTAELSAGQDIQEVPAAKWTLSAAQRQTAQAPDRRIPKPA